MRLRLEATPQELYEKAPDFLDKLADAFEPVHPELADVLAKALRKEPSLKFRLLRELHQQTRDAYAKQLDAMLADIDKVLDRSSKASSTGKMEKAEVYDYSRKIYDQDARAYERVKQVLMRQGYKRADFEAGGTLDGYSVNELVDLARAKKGG